MTSTYFLCPACKWYKQDSTCKAFPDGIPPKVQFLEFDHHKPYPGDNGIQFEPADFLSDEQKRMFTTEWVAFEDGEDIVAE